MNSVHGSRTGTEWGKSPMGNRCVRLEKQLLHSLPTCYGSPVNADEGSLCVQDW